MNKQMCSSPNSQFLGKNCPVYTKIVDMVPSPKQPMQDATNITQDKENNNNNENEEHQQREGNMVFSQGEKTLNQQSDDSSDHDDRRSLQCLEAGTTDITDDDCKYDSAQTLLNLDRSGQQQQIGKQEEINQETLVDIKSKQQQLVDDNTQFQVQISQQQQKQQVARKKQQQQQEQNQQTLFLLTPSQLQVTTSMGPPQQYTVPIQHNIPWSNGAVQVIQQPIQNPNYLSQLYNAQGQLLMPGNIALHNGMDSQAYIRVIDDQKGKKKVATRTRGVNRNQYQEGVYIKLPQAMIDCQPPVQIISPIVPGLQPMQIASPWQFNITTQVGASNGIYPQTMLAPNMFFMQGTQPVYMQGIQSPPISTIQIQQNPTEVEQFNVQKMKTSGAIIEITQSEQPNSRPSILSSNKSISPARAAASRQAGRIRRNITRSFFNPGKQQQQQQHKQKKSMNISTQSHNRESITSKLNEKPTSFVESSIQPSPVPSVDIGAAVMQPQHPPPTSENGLPPKNVDSEKMKERCPPKAMVKPQVMTHVIEDFVIHESSEPFPVSRSSIGDLEVSHALDRDSDEPPRKKHALPSSSNGMSSPKGCVDGEMGICEACGTIDLKAKFKKNKSFCSVLCSKFGKREMWSEKNSAMEVDVESCPLEPDSSLSPGVDDNAQKVDPLKWSAQEVSDFIRNLPDCSNYAEDFLIQGIDGQALMLLKEDHLMTAMSMKLGPALKIVAEIDDMRGDKGPPKQN